MRNVMLRQRTGAPPRPRHVRLRHVRTLGAAAGALAAIALAGCGGSSGSSSSSSTKSVASASTSSTGSSGGSCKPGATHLTFWGWAGGYDLVVKKFNETHPKICVTLSNNGANVVEYAKLSSALKAGSGTPDVAEIEYTEVPSFEITNDLVNLVPYGVNNYKKDIVPAAFQAVSQGSAVNSMPGDIGPLGFYYNKPLLAKYKLTPPTTWTQFASEAMTLHKDDPSAYLANFDPAEGGGQWLYALMQQYGAFPFKYSGGKNVTIDLTGPKQMAFANFWQKLIAAGVINHTTDFSPIFWHNLDNGVDASWLSAAWSPADQAPNMKKTIGDWRAAPMPQVTAGQDIDGSWGGSTFAVIKGTAHPAQAAEFAEWFGGTLASWKILNSPAAGAFPGFKPLLDSAALKNGKIPLSGSSKPNPVYVAGAAHTVAISWPPFMTDAFTTGTSVYGGILNGSVTVPQALETMQKDLVSYAKSQGFDVTQ
jgi:multiple sugar transport system substrate-binding protein